MPEDLMEALALATRAENQAAGMSIIGPFGVDTFFELVNCTRNLVEELKVLRRAKEKQS